MRNKEIMGFMHEDYICPNCGDIRILFKKRDRKRNIKF